jgi:2-(1,2-epoxy-1,2-dihydrophenyl)acetyl-CoA isomerase
MKNDLFSQLNMESEYQIQAAQSKDYNEGVAAFLEKRKPIFKGE